MATFGENGGMQLGKRDRGRIAGLLYPIIFETNPLEAVDRTMAMVVDAGGMESSPEEFLAAIQAGLASRERLSELLPQPHGESAVREYLAAMAARISAGPCRRPS